MPVQNNAVQDLKSLEQKIRNAKYILFDFDDTLVLSIHLWKIINESVLKKLGIIIDIDDFQNTISGMCMWDVVHFTRAQYNIQDKTDDQIYEIWITEAISKFSEASQVPGAVQFIKNIKRLPNSPKLGVASASPIQVLTATLKTLDIYQTFDAIVSCDERRISKPDPDVFLQCLLRMGGEIPQTDNDQILLFEDSISGLQAANATRCKNITCILSRDEQIEAKKGLSRWQINDYTQIADIIGK